MVAAAAAAAAGNALGVKKKRVSRWLAGQIPEGKIDRSANALAHVAASAGQSFKRFHTGCSMHWCVSIDWPWCKRGLKDWYS
jgi:hypothetical protein